MSLSDLKTYFRTVIKVLAGGPPVGTVGSNRAAGVLAALDKLAEFADGQADSPYTAGPGIAIDADHLISAATVALELPLAQPQPAANEVAAPVLHAITGLWNGDTTDTTVYVFGLNAGAFASTGWVVDGAGVVQAVKVNVAAGTWEVQQTLNQKAIARLAPVFVNKADGEFVGFDSLADLAAAADTGTLNLNDATITLNESQRLTVAIADSLNAYPCYIRGNGLALYTDAGSPPVTLAQIAYQDIVFGGRIALYSATLFNTAPGTGVLANSTITATDSFWDYGSGPIAGTLILRPGTTTNGTPVLVGAGKVVDERGGTGGGTTPAIAAPQWVAGSQKEGALVYNADSLYRVRQTIANSQVAPTATSQYYQLIGPYAGSGGAAVPDIDFASPVVHTVSVALTAADFGKLHVLSGSTALTLTLPDPVAGKQIAVSVDAQSTALHTILPPSSSSLDTFSEVQTWAGELRQWAVIGATYLKTNGRVKAMRSQLAISANQTAQNNAVIPVQVNTVQDQAGIGLADPAAFRLWFPRAGNWKIGFLGFVVGVPLNTYVEFLARLNGQLDAKTVNGFSTANNYQGTTFGGIRANETRLMAKGDYVDLVVFVSGGNGTIDAGQAAWLQTKLYIEEQGPY